MNRNVLFLNTLQDIKERLIAQDEYKLLGVAGLLRKLLLDKHSLIDQVNQEQKLKIRFKTNKRAIPMDTSISFWSIEDGLDPDTAFKKIPIEVNKDQFLATIVMIVSGKQYSIKDIILHAANISGAIHAGKPENQKEELLKKISDEYSIGGYRANLRILQAISRVALKALCELEEKIKS